MPRVARLASLLAALVVPFAATRPAWAQSPEPRPFSLKLTLAEGCPDAEQFLLALQERTPGAVLVEPVAADVRLTIELRGDGWGSVEVTTPEGSSRRELQSRSCEEALGATAVVASMVLEAEAARRRESAPPKEAPQLEPAPSEGTPADSSKAIDEPQQSEPPASVARERWWQLGFFLGAGLETAVAPTPPLGLAFGAQAESRRPRWWTPAVRLEALATASAVERVDGGAGKFRLMTARLSGCSLNARLSPAWRLAACISLDAGSYLAAGSGETLNTRQRSMPWLALGLAVRSHWALGERARIEASLGARRLQRHDQFVIRPESLVYAVPPFSAGFELTLSWQAL